MKNAVLGSLLAVLVAGASLAVPAGAAVLDQSWEGVDPPVVAGGFVRLTGIDIAQTFTVGLTGTLDHVEISLGRTADTTAGLQVRIRSLLAGFPDPAPGAVLGTFLIAAADVPVIGATVAGPFDFGPFAFISADFSGAGIDVTTGEQYAIEIESISSPGGYAWALTAGDTYAGGHGFFRSHAVGGPFSMGGGDQYFRTFVDVPEPATLALVGLGLVGLRLTRRGQASAA